MASKNKYKKAKLRIHPITIITLGLILSAIIVAVILSIPSKGTRLARKFADAASELGVSQNVAVVNDNNIKRITSENKAINAITKGKNEAVVIVVGSFESAFTVSNVGVFYQEFNLGVELDTQGKNTGPKMSDYATFYFYDYGKLDKGVDKVNSLLESLGIDLEVDEDDPALILTFVDGKLAVNSKDVNKPARHDVARAMFKETIALIK